MSKKRQIVNIINFIRASEPRDRSLDLVRPVVEQVRLLNEYGFKGTFLYQYDALLRQDLIDPPKACQNPVEFGLWLEIMQPLCEAAGIEWRGRPGFDWDWHAHCGFSVGYTLKEREKLCDVAFEKFREVFGVYPKVVGSWLIDAYTLRYMEKRYGIIGSCNCKEQWGTDGYTMWGGYYNQAYYPSVHNVMTPAQTKENQINVPVFRMLGVDPIYQYDAGLVWTDDGIERAPRQSVYTLEPVYLGDGGGGDPAWVDWYLKENFAPDTLSYGYTQVGQENSFGWEGMKDGLTLQFGRIAKLVAEGKVEVETLGESSEWFIKTYPLTPAATLTAYTDWRDENRRTLWYYNRNYRVNFLRAREGQVYVRDWFLFDENDHEFYWDEPCKEEDFFFELLPVMEGNRWSGGRTWAGIYPVWDGDGEHCDELGHPEKTGENDLRFTVTTKEGSYQVDCTEETMTFNSQLPGFALEFRQAEGTTKPVVDGHRLCYSIHGTDYAVAVVKGRIASSEQGVKVLAENGEIRFERG